MVVVTVELWPKGDQSKSRGLGVICISNVGGTAEFGDYEISVAHGGAYFGKPGRYRHGKVTGFRRSLSPYHLLARALAACGIR